MIDSLSQRLVPDEMWTLVEPLIPPAKVRPQGGGRSRTDPRAVFTAIVFVLTSGCAWRHLHQALLDELGSQSLIHWSRAVLAGASVRAKKGGDVTGPSPVDRGKPGSKIHAISDRAGLPLAVGVSAANTHDSEALKPLVNAIPAIPAIRSRRGPRRRKPAKLHADKAYDIPALHTWLRRRGIIPRIARKGLNSSTTLGKHRWVIERSIAWLLGYRRLTIRYERKATHFPAFLTLGAAITSYKKLTK